MAPLKRWLWCVVMCASSVVLAQAPRATVMPFPLDIKRTTTGFTKEEKEGLQKEYVRLVRQAGGQVPEYSRYELVLKELKRQDCEREDECLTQLAKRAETLYALYASIDYTVEGAVIATGRVVRDDGKIASPTATVKIPKGKDAFKDIAKNALVQLLGQLKVNELPAVRPVDPVVTNPPVVKDPVTNEPPPPLPPVVVEDTGKGQRTAGKAMVVTGIAVAAVGGIVAGVGGGIGGSAAHEGRFATSDAAANQLSTGQALVTAGLVGVGVGAVVGVVGAVVWGTAKAPPAEVSFVPLNNGGGVVQIGGRF